MSGQRIGYIRVSTLDQHTERQLDGIELDKTFTDKASGKDTKRTSGRIRARTYGFASRNRSGTSVCLIGIVLSVEENLFLSFFLRYSTTEFGPFCHL